VIIGLERAEKVGPKRLFSYASPSSDPVENVVSFINAYLVEGPNVLVTKRMKPLNPQLGPVDSGSKAVDWGYLSLENGPSDNMLQEARQDPIAAKYLRPFLGGEELINRIDSWCSSPRNVPLTPRSFCFLVSVVSDSERWQGSG